jgi:hypothetical protein
MSNTLKYTLLITTVCGVYGFLLPSMVSSKSNELTILGAVIIIGTVVGVISALGQKLKGE